VWTLSNGFCFVTFADHTAPVTAVQFLPRWVCRTAAGDDGYGLGMAMNCAACWPTTGRACRTACSIPAAVWLFHFTTPANHSSP